MLFSLPLLLMPLLVGAAPAQKYGPQLNQLAPEANLQSWLKGTRPKHKRIEQYRGEVLVIHTFAWNCSSCLKVGIPLVVDLNRAAAERGFNAISLTTAAMTDETTRVIKEFGLQSPVALVNPFSKTCPYADASTNPFTYIFVIGRNGELVWRGDPSRDVEVCLDAIGQALAAPADQGLKPGLHEELGPAIGTWFEEDYSKTKKLATKLVSKHGKRKKEASQQITQDAQWLLERMQRLSDDLLARLESSLANADALTFQETMERIERGFPKTLILTKALEIHSRGIENEEFMARLQVAKEWHEIMRARPVLFPERREKPEKKWAKSLAKFLKKHSESPWGEEAHSLLQAWEAAA